MKRSQLKILAGCMLSCLAALFVLYATSSVSKEIYRGPFTRTMLPDSGVVKISELNLGYNSYYIAGLSNGSIHLANYASPLHTISLKYDLEDSLHNTILIPGLDSIVKPQRIITIVDSPYFYVTHGINPYLFRGKIGAWKAERFMADSAYFVEAVPINRSSFILRSYSKRSNAYELAKENSSAPYFEFKYGILEKQGEGLFSSEGKINYSKQENKVVYTYTYKNSFTVLDTLLNINNVYHTIDTFSHVNIKAASIKSQNSSMLSAPPTVVNVRSIVAGDRIFIQSNILDRTGDKERFLNGATIDIYSIKNGTYMASIYLRQDQKKLSDFKVFQGRLVAIFDDTIVVYKIKIVN